MDIGLRLPAFHLPTFQREQNASGPCELIRLGIERKRMTIRWYFLERIV